MTARSSASVALCLVAVLASAGAAAAGPKATETVLREPVALAVDGGGNLYVADQREHRIWRVAPDGSIAAFAGTGESGFGGDGGPAVEARLDEPVALVFRGTDLFVAEAGNKRIRKIDAKGTISTVAGTGRMPGVFVDPPPVPGAAPVPALGVAIDPAALAADSAGNVYVADKATSALLKLAPDGTTVRIAGDGQTGHEEDHPKVGAPRLSARLFQPESIQIGPAGEIFFIDKERLFEIDREGLIRQVSGEERLAASPKPAEDPAATPEIMPLSRYRPSRGSGLLFDDAGNLLVLHGEKADAADASFRAVLASERELLVEVQDDRLVTGSAKWLYDDHLELWLADGPSEGAQTSNLWQWGVRIADGRVHPAHGKPKDPLEVERAERAQAGDPGGTVRLKITLPEPASRITLV